MKGPARQLPLVIALAIGSGGAAAAPHAHQHGALTLTVALDGEQLSIGLQAPLDSLLGFERAPRTDAERRAAKDLLARLRSGAATLFKADGAAQCTLVSAEVRAGVLEAAPKSAVQATPRGEDHADLDADYAFRCMQPALLRTLNVGLFEAFEHLRRIEVQVAGPKGQRKLTLQRPARTLELQHAALRQR
jgi:hypothetical protein